MKKDTIKVVIIDDELRALNRIKILLNHFDNIVVTGQFTEPTLGFEFITSNFPDLVFLDIEMPNISGLEIAREIKKSSRQTKLVFVTSHEHYAIKAIKMEVFDYLLKPVSIDELDITVNRFNKQKQFNLSNRELEIVKCISDGKNSKAIGKLLNISHHTVDTHRRTILEKTNCSNAAELIKYAINLDLV